MTSTDTAAVVVLRWPEDADQRWVFASAGMPRLLVVAADEPPPALVGPLEDWVRSPADPDDIRARVAHLVDRQRKDPAPRPVLEDGDILRHRGDWVPLSPAESLLLRRLLEDFDHCVPRDELDLAGGAAVLNTRIKRVRRRIAPLGLAIRTVRGRGFVLSDDPGPPR